MEKFRLFQKKVGKVQTLSKELENSGFRRNLEGLCRIKKRLPGLTSA